MKRENITQIMIMIFSGGSIAFFTTDDYKYIGFIFVLLSEPFWFYETLKNKQWGMFLLSIWYTCAATYGLYKWVV